MRRTEEHPSQQQNQNADKLPRGFAVGNHVLFSASFHGKQPNVKRPVEVKEVTRKEGVAKTLLVENDSNSSNKPIAVKNAIAIHHRPASMLHVFSTVIALHRRALGAMIGTSFDWSLGAIRPPNHIC